MQGLESMKLLHSQDIAEPNMLAGQKALVAVQDIHDSPAWTLPS